MKDTIEVVTPEGVAIQYELAGIGSRGLAAVIDHAIQLLVTVVGLLLLVLVTYMVSATVPIAAGDVPLWMIAVALIWVFAVLVGYHAVFELRWGGQTPGKRLAGLRVMRDSGHPVDPYSTVVRNLVRIVDLLLLFPYGAGMLSVFFSKECKRLGDWAAGTVVVRETVAEAMHAIWQTPASGLVASLMDCIQTTRDLDPQQLVMLRVFTERRGDLDPAGSDQMARRIALPLVSQLAPDLLVSDPWPYAEFVEAVVRRNLDENRRSV